jgi:hypothetical protein
VEVETAVWGCVSQQARKAVPPLGGLNVPEGAYTVHNKAGRWHPLPGLPHQLPKYTVLDENTFPRQVVRQPLTHTTKFANNESEAAIGILLLVSKWHHR